MFPMEAFYFAFLLHFIMHQTICCQFVQKIPCLPDPFRGPSVGMMSFQLAQVLGEKPKGFRPKMHQLKIHNNPSVTWAGKPRLGTTPGILHLDGRGHSGFCVCVCVTHLKFTAGGLPFSKPSPFAGFLNTTLLKYLTKPDRTAWRFKFLSIFIFRKYLKPPT